MPLDSERGAHGYSLDLAIVDEAWALKDYRVPGAITPTQIARPDPQLWVVSTAGTSDSLWLRELVEAGRAGDEPSGSRSLSGRRRPSSTRATSRRGRRRTRR